MTEIRKRIGSRILSISSKVGEVMELVSENQSEFEKSDRDDLKKIMDQLDELWDKFTHYQKAEES